MTISLYTDLGVSQFRCMGEGDRAPTSREAIEVEALTEEEANLTYKCHTTRISPARVIKLPELLTRFMGIIISGESVYRRGMPISPKKCCGKNVTLTPKNTIQNLA